MHFLLILKVISCVCYVSHCMYYKPIKPFLDLNTIATIVVYFLNKIYHVRTSSMSMRL